MRSSAALKEAAPYEAMSPTLLSMQPVSLKREESEKDKNWPQIFDHLERQFASLRQWRWSWWTHWARLAEYFNPRRYVWLVTANKMWRGGAINDAIIDSTGLQAVRTCASGMWTGLTSPSREWFAFEKALPWVELDEEGKEWIEDTQKRVYTVLAASNFYSSMHVMFSDETVFGTGPILVYEDFEDIIRLFNPAPGEYYLAVGARNTVDVFTREFTFTVRQIVEMFTLERCPIQVSRAWAQGQYDFEFVVCHNISPNHPVPNLGADGSKQEEIKLCPEKFTWAESYWLKGIKTKNPLSIKPFNEKPFAVFQWWTVSNDAYGRSPCMDTLGDNKQLQRQTVREAEYIEKGVRPPMGADARLKSEPLSQMPAHVTYMNVGEGGKSTFFPLYEVSPQWLPGLVANKEKVATRIQDCLYVNLFLAITRMEGVQPRNELELTKRDLERLQELGPVIHNAEQQLSLILRRVLAIMERRRLLKPMPQSLMTGNNGMPVPLKITYTSIMRLAQLAAEGVAMKDTLATAGGLSSAAKAAGVPDPIRVIDLDKAMRRIGEINNFPIDCFFTDEQVQQHDQARERGQAQAAAPQQAMAAVQAAKTLADTSTAPGSALSALTGGGAPGGGA